ncbi:MAG: hypothetical protein QXQ77_01715 [Candidatus Aenigmatarchaeota archaeon]
MKEYAGFAASILKNQKRASKILFSEKFRIADFPILYAVPRAEEVRNLILNLKYKS